MTPGINLALVSTTLVKMTAGYNDTCDKFCAGINNTGEQLSPLTFFPSVIDTGHKKTKSLKFILGVKDTVKKMSASTRWLNLDRSLVRAYWCCLMLESL
jgi:hypothetical protein